MKNIDLQNVDFEKIEVDINKWATSRNGQQTIGDAVEAANKVVDQLREALFVHQERLNEPVTL